MIFVWIITIWVVAALLYGVYSISRQAGRRPSAPSIMPPPDAPKDSTEHERSEPEPEESDREC